MTIGQPDNNMMKHAHLINPSNFYENESKQDTKSQTFLFHPHENQAYNLIMNVFLQKKLYAYRYARQCK